MAVLEALLGRKLGMTQIFAPDGAVVPVTVLQGGPCVVLQVRTREKDGYPALQLGFDDARLKRATKPAIGHAKKAGTGPKRFVREVSWDGDAVPAAGTVLTCEQFKEVAQVDVIGTSKGRGYQGGMKKWGFSGGGAAHGSKHHRKPGSVGQHTFPNRVFPGKKMAGHYGATRFTVRNLRVVAVDPERGRILVRGAVPGANGGYVVIRRALTLRKKAGA